MGSVGLALPAGSHALDVALALDDDDALVSRAECSARSTEEVEITWDLGSSSGETVEILGSDASGCSEDDATTEVLVDDLDTSTTSYTDLTVEDFLGAAGESAGTCDGDDFRVYVCVRLLDGDGAEVATGSVALRFQLERPPPPVSVSVTPGEGALHVSWAAGTATTGATASSESYQVFASAGGETVSSSETSDTSLRLEGLEDGVTYDVVVVAYSEAGNASDDSESKAGAPQSVDDFYELYLKAGGERQGGCGAGGAGDLACLLLLAALLLALRRRSRARGGGALLVVLLALALPGRGGAATPSWGSVELGVATYRPAVDSGLDGATPWKDVFGSRARPSFQLAVSWAPVSGTVGRLELGVRSGFFRASGKGRFADGSVSGDQTSFNLVPTSAILTARAHLSSLGVPLDPYARLGLERYNWWVTDGSSRTSRRGATHGWSASLGVAFSLTLLDRESGRMMESEAGLKDVGLFAEAGWSRVDDFGKRGSWDLSHRGVSLGGGLLVAF